MAELGVHHTTSGKMGRRAGHREIDQEFCHGWEGPVKARFFLTSSGTMKTS